MHGIFALMQVVTFVADIDSTNIPANYPGVEISRFETGIEKVILFTASCDAGSSLQILAFDFAV
jgi:hypothetical protein